MKIWLNKPLKCPCSTFGGGEKGSAGARYHAVAEQGVPLRDIAGVIGRRLNVPVVAKSPEEAADHFGWFAHFATLDNPASTRERGTCWDGSRSTLGSSLISTGRAISRLKRAHKRHSVSRAHLIVLSHW